MITGNSDLSWPIHQIIPSSNKDWSIFHDYGGWILCKTKFVGHKQHDTELNVYAEHFYSADDLECLATDKCQPHICQGRAARRSLSL